MTRRRVPLLVALAVVGAPLLLSGTSSADVGTVQGSAYGAKGSVSLFGGPPMVSAPSPMVTLPPGGGLETLTVPSRVVQFGPAVFFRSGPVTVTTEGAPGPTGSVTSSTWFSPTAGTSTTPCLFAYPGTFTANSPIVTSATANFTAADVGRFISSEFLPVNTTGTRVGERVASIVTVNSPTSVTISSLAEGSGDGYVSIERGVGTCIYNSAFTADTASSTCTASETGITASTHFTNGFLVTATDDFQNPTVVVPIPDDPAPNLTINGFFILNGNTTESFTFVFNEQIINPDGSVTVNAAHLRAHGETAIGDVYFGSSTCGVTVLPSLSIADASVTEGDSGTTLANFTITRTGDVTSPSSVDWSTTDGSAIAPGDYAAPGTGTVTFAAGETTKTVSVTVNGDTAIEPNDGFTVNLTNPVGASIADGTAVGRITNDDFATFSVSDATVVEGDNGSISAVFTVTRSGATAGAATVQWYTIDVHATAGSDYMAVAPTTLSFAPGDLSETVSVTVNGDTVVEPTEDFYVRLLSPTGGHTLADSTGLGTITNDDFDAVNSFAISDATVTEGDSGPVAANFTVSRTGDTSEAASVQWYTVAGTGTPGIDYVNVNPTTLNFAAGEITKPVSVTVNGDTAVEATETFSVRLGSPVGATIAGGSGLGRITNDDAAAFSINDVTVTEGNAGTTTATFTVTRSGDTGGTATVQWFTANGTAIQPGDYTAVAPTPLTFAAGQTIATVSVSVIGDTAPEGNETFAVRLTSPVGASIADGSGLGRITNDD